LCISQSARFSDTRLNYTRPGFDDDPAVLVRGDVDPHLGADLGLVCRVGRGQGGGDVLEAGDEGLDDLSGELRGGCFPGWASSRRRSWLVSAIHLPTVGAASGSVRTMVR